MADLIGATQLIWNAATKLINEKGQDAALEAPPKGWRIPIAADAVVVLQRHFSRHSLVAATIIEKLL